MSVLPIRRKPVNHDIERSGIDRRNNDGHCDNHEKNTTDISGMRASMSTMKWFVGLLVPASLIVTGWFQIDNRNELKDIAMSVKEMQASMHMSITADAVRRLELEQIKRDVDELRNAARAPEHSVR